MKGILLCFIFLLNFKSSRSSTLTFSYCIYKFWYSKGIVLSIISLSSLFFVYLQFLLALSHEIIFTWIINNHIYIISLIEIINHNIKFINNFFHKLVCSFIFSKISPLNIFFNVENNIVLSFVFCHLS